VQGTICRHFFNLRELLTTRKLLISIDIIYVTIKKKEIITGKLAVIEMSSQWKKYVMCWFSPTIHFFVVVIAVVV
jgi:hypothetical protein